jgi:hypothetical protein
MPCAGITDGRHSTEWHIDALQPILDKVYEDYRYDRNRTYLGGYSMGARDSYKALLNMTGVRWTVLTSECSIRAGIRGGRHFSGRTRCLVR